MTLVNDLRAVRLQAELARECAIDRSAGTARAAEYAARWAQRVIDGLDLMIAREEEGE